MNGIGMMYSWMSLLPILCYLLLALAVGVSLVRLLWIAGSYLKRKTRQLA
jgi:hypothetical protein